MTHLFYLPSLFNLLIVSYECSECKSMNKFDFNWLDDVLQLYRKLIEKKEITKVQLDGPYFVCENHMKQPLIFYCS